jgi:uncharacterized protein YndB with AHSA1/START domain
MNTLEFNVNIEATRHKVWQVLWNDYTYRQWTRAFHEGSYAISEWKEGSRIQFLGPGGNGMYSVIDQLIENELISFKHLGIVKAFEEQPESEETKQWDGAIEKYNLKEENGITKVTVSLNSLESFIDYFNKTFPKALADLKELSEKPVVITIEAIVTQPIEKVWTYWTEPTNICKWNNASEDWHTTRAENDLKVGGRFLSRMEAKDGSFGFDFIGTYTAVETHKKIDYVMQDGRMAKTSFIKQDNGIKIVTSFDAEEINSFDLQKGGWQAILDNFKKYTESN